MDTASEMNTSEMTVSEIRPQLDKLQRTALVIAVVGLVLAAVGFVLPTGDADDKLSQFFQSYLFSYLFWWGVTTG